MNIKPVESIGGAPLSPSQPQKHKASSFAEQCLYCILQQQSKEHPEILTQRLSAAALKTFLEPAQIQQMVAAIQSPGTPEESAPVQEPSPYLEKNAVSLLNAFCEEEAKAFLQKNPNPFPAIGALKDNQLKLKILQIYIKEEDQPAWYAIANINKLKIDSEEVRFHIALELAQHRADILLQHIGDFNLSEEHLVALAFQCATVEPEFPNSFSHFPIGDEKKRKEIALFCCRTQRGSESVATNISDFELSESNRYEVAKACANWPAGLQNVVHEMKDFNLPEEIRFQFGLQCCFQEIIFEHEKLDLSEDDHRTLRLLQKAVHFLKSRQSLPAALSELDMAADLPLKKIFDSLKEDPKRNGCLFFILIALRLNPSLRADEEAQKWAVSLVQYRHTPLTLFLIQLFCTEILPHYRKAYQELATHPYLHLPLLAVAKWLTHAPDLKPLAEIIKQFVQQQRTSFKDMRIGLERAWLLTIESLEKSLLSSENKMHLLAAACQTSSPEEMKKRLSLIRALCSLRMEHLLERPFTEKMTEELASLLSSTIQSDPYAPLAEIEDFVPKYLATWGATRIPLAWLTYETMLKKLDDPEVQQTFGRMIVSVLNNTYRQERYRTDLSLHLAKLRSEAPTVWEAWKQAREPKPLRIESVTQADLILADTDHWEDLFLSGSEMHSCQEVDGDPAYSRSLLGLVMDGKNRLLCIKDKQTGTLLARAVFRLLWDNKHSHPVLFLEAFYPRPSPPQPFKEALFALARERAHELQCPLVMNDLYQIAKPYDGEVVSLGSPAPYEYVDGASSRINLGFEKGIYRMLSPTEEAML